MAQCSTSFTEPPITGSGSCRISTKLCVPAGAFDQEMAGDGLVCPAAHVNFAGTLAPSAKAATLMLIMGGGPPCFFAPLSCAFIHTADASSVVAIASRVENMEKPPVKLRIFRQRNGSAAMVQVV